jgi:hypothetical protein
MPSTGPGQHLATISHEGRFWDVYLELEEAHAGPVRGRLRFTAADQSPSEPVARTGFILVEATPEEVHGRARELNTHQLSSLLRSCLP